VKLQDYSPMFSLFICQRGRMRKWTHSVGNHRVG
jgi:hypothetical protein